MRGTSWDALGHRIGRYLFVSSHAVHRREDVAGGADESAALREPLAEAADLDDETYGRLKVACEAAVLGRLGERAAVVRPGRVAGPHGPSDALTYWARRASRGGAVVVPGSPAQPVQVVEVRDLAALMLRVLEGGSPEPGPRAPRAVVRAVRRRRIGAPGADSRPPLVPVTMRG